MSISLNRALGLLKFYREQARELSAKLEYGNLGVYTYVLEDGEPLEPVETLSVEATLELLGTYQGYVRELHRLLSQANLTVTDYAHGDRLLTLGELVLLIQQVRETLPHLKKLGARRSNKTRSRDRVGLETLVRTNVVQLLYDPTVYEKDTRRWEQQVMLMQETIDRYNTTLTVPFEETMLEA